MTRLIAGSRGGRRITVPPTATRPTTDRVREALFSALASWAGTAAGPPEESLRGLAFVDLYAGSGAVGLEAASRGAFPVWLVEGHRRTALVAERNVRALELPAVVVSTRVEDLVGRSAETSFDVIFADPPYELEDRALDATVSKLLENGWLGDRGLMVVERSRRSSLRWGPRVVESWTRRYGETLLHFGVLGEVD